MRISVCKDDPGYDDRAFGRCKVFLDGADITQHCYTADEEEGKVWCRKVNEVGASFIDPATGKCANEVFTGKVEIFLAAKCMNGNDSYSCH